MKAKLTENLKLPIMLIGELVKKTGFSKDTIRF